GFSVFGSGVQLPAYCQFSGTGKADYTWTDSSQDTRAMQRVVGTGRVAAVWYSSTLFLLNLDLTDGETHRIAFYFLDWDNGGRTQTVEVLDANSAAVLYSCVLSEFTGGKYLVWDLKGNLKIRITKVSGPNALLAAVFFDPRLDEGSDLPVAPYLSCPIQQRMPAFDGFRLHVAGEAGQPHNL